MRFIGLLKYHWNDAPFDLLLFDSNRRGIRTDTKWIRRENKNKRGVFFLLLFTRFNLVIICLYVFYHRVFARDSLLCYAFIPCVRPYRKSTPGRSFPFFFSSLYNIYEHLYAVDISPSVERHTHTHTEHHIYYIYSILTLKRKRYVNMSKNFVGPKDYRF